MHDRNSHKRFVDTNNEGGPPALLDEPPSSRSADRIHTINYDRKGFAQGERGIYAIVDTITNTIIGGLQLHINNASAIRLLNDIANSETSLNKNPLDYELRLLGIINNDNTITQNLNEIIVVGDQIAAMIQPRQGR